MDKVSLIVVCFNSYSVIESCLSPVIDSGLYQVLIVDNASSDGSVSLLRNRFPQADIIALDKNIGYGRAANVALNRVGSTFSLLLNPDILITSKQVDELVEKAERIPSAALFVPATAHKHTDLGENPVQKNNVSGSCMLFHMNKLKEVGFFDENIFLFSEETDLCVRILEQGFEIVLFPDVYVKHLAGESSGYSDAVEYMKEWHFGWSRSYYYHKHGLDHGRKALWRRLLIYKWKSFLAFRSRRKKIKYSAIYAGIFSFRAGHSAFLEDGMPQVNPATLTNPYRKNTQK